jgi:1-acyl-sn-glycerol-3-phosphate acyltransferase
MEHDKPQRRRQSAGAAPPVGFLQQVATYLVTNVTVGLLWIFFKVLNRTTVFGREHVGTERNTLLLSNHQSMIDSFLVGIFAFYPNSWLKPYLIPWNPAAEENFFKNRVQTWLAHAFRCIPIKEGRRDPLALRRMVELLPTGVMTLFPEGARSRTGRVREGRLGAGLVIRRARPKVIPVAIDGMQDLLPIGSSIPRIFKRIYISYGPPLDYSEFLDHPRRQEAAQGIVDKVMEAIRTQHDEIRRLRTGKGPDDA